MPKIPTFTSRREMTTEAPSVRSNIRISPTATTASALLPAAKAIDDYYIKQRDNTEKLEARKKYYEMKSESDKVMEKYKNNSDEFSSVNGYNQEIGEYRKQQLSQIKNKRIKKRLENLLDLDQSENIYKIKENSFDAFEKESEVTYENGQNILANEYNLETNEELKQKKLQERIELAAEYENMHNKGKAWLDETIIKIKGDAELLEIDKAVANKNYTAATELLKKSKNIDSETVQSTIIKIQKESVEYNETNFHVSNIIEGKNTLIGADLKNTTEKKVLQSTDNALFANASKNKLSKEETFAYVDQVYSKTGILSPTYKDLFESAYNTGSTTTFDSNADIPDQLKLAVKSAEIADRTGRLNNYTTTEQERFFKNVIVLKKILGLDNYQAITRAKDFEMNYDQELIRGATKRRNRTLDKLETKFKETKVTNLGEVKSYASKLYNMYIASGIDDGPAETQVLEDIESSIIEIDDHAYFKRDIEPFKNIGGLDQVKPVKEYIISKRLTNEDPNDYYMRHIGGGLFEIRREVDLSTVYGDDGQPLLFYQKDLINIVKGAKTEQEEKEKLSVIGSQDEKQINKEQTTSDLLIVEGS